VRLSAEEAAAVKASTDLVPVNLGSKPPARPRPPPSGQIYDRDNIPLFTKLLREDSKCYVVHLITLGDAGVGKTTLLEAIRNGFVRPMRTHSATVGVEMGALYMPVISKEGEWIKLTTWDTAGQERMRSLVGQYVKNAHVCLMIYDIRDSETRDRLVSYWLPEMAEKYSSRTLRFIWVATQLDEFPYQDLVNARMEEDRKTFERAMRLNMNPTCSDPLVFGVSGTGTLEMYQNALFVTKLVDIIQTDVESSVDSPTCAYRTMPNLMSITREMDARQPQSCCIGLPFGFEFWGQ
jgi:small GTP-binding protein